MYCPEYVLISNRFLYLQIMCKGDYSRKRWIPKTHWIHPFRYSVTFFPMSNKWRTRINSNAKRRIPVSNFIYRLKIKLGIVRG